MFSLPSPLMSILLRLGIFFPCPPLVCQGRVKGGTLTSEKEGVPFQSGQSWWAESLTSLFFVVLGLVNISHVNRPLFVCLCYQDCCCCCSLSFLLAVSSELFLPGLVILAFCVSSWRGNRGSTKLGNTIPKP